MITCPDKRTKNWKQLVKAVGEPTAYAVWNAKEGLVEDYLNSLSQPTSQPQAEQDLAKLVEELRRNKEFIQLDESEEFYINTKTNQKYQRVTDYTSEEKVEDTPLLEASKVVGNNIDRLVRDFFSDNLKEYTDYGIDSSKLFDSFITELEKVKKNLEKRGEKVLANDIVLYNDELGIAGTVDLITYDKDGNFRIYDMKTKRSGVSYIDSKNFGKSDRQKWTEQLSLYRILLNNTHGIEAKQLGIMPIKVMYSEESTTTSELSLLKGIKIEKLDKVKDAKLAALETTTSKDTEAKKKQLQDKIDALKKQLPTPKLVMPQQVSGRIGGIFNELNAIAKANPRVRAKKEEALYKKYGTEAVNKAKALESKFQNIVEQLIEKKLNFFYNEETQEHVKRCF